MRQRQAFHIGVLFALTTAAAIAAPQRAALTVHEWGTFLSMQGSDGVTLDGMYHEEHALPAFVHARGKDQLRLPTSLSKGETPVIYFYTAAPTHVNVEVGFPRGIWTQWYPQAAAVRPGLTQLPSVFSPRGGRIRWSAELSPTPFPDSPIPSTSSDALWNHARRVDAAWVRTKRWMDRNAPWEAERFLFYRGLGAAPLPVTYTAQDGGTLKLEQTCPEGVSDLFVIHVSGGKGWFRYLPALGGAGSSDSSRQLRGILDAPKGTLPAGRLAEEVADRLAARLTAAGLFPKESRAMVNTWRESYFESEGTRVLFLLPQAWTDRFIPMRVTPTPQKLVRVMVGRLELLSADREHLALEAVQKLASADTKQREAAFDFLRAQGRYVEPILRRVLRSTPQGPDRTRIRRLLLTDFVTDLRSSLISPAAGRRQAGRPEYLQAQLAAVLREIGLEQEARSEAEAALKSLPPPAAIPLDDDRSRHPLRARARALEAAGRPAEALAAYEQLIRFGSQALTREACVICHRAFDNGGPTSAEWFKSWWAGTKYAAISAASDQRKATAQELQAAVDRNPRDAASRLLLAYLEEPAGSAPARKSQWALLPHPPGASASNAR